MMNDHKIVIEMVVGRALPSASKLSEVLDEINRDIRMDFAHNDWYAEIKRVDIEKVMDTCDNGKQEMSPAPSIKEASVSVSNFIRKEVYGLTKEEFQQEMKRLMNTVIIGSGENE